MSKRSNPFAQFAAPSSEMAKRLRRVEKLASANKGEMKHKVMNCVLTPAAANVASVNLTDLSLGNAVNQRVGNKIKIWRVEIRGLANVQLDYLVLQSHDGSAPGVGDFHITGAYGSMITDSKLNTKFTEWKHFRNPNYYTGSLGLKIILKFKTGMIVKYDGSTTAPVENALYAVVVNGTPSTTNTSYGTARIWYTDV